MSLFGPPNVDKLLKKGDVGKLVELLTHKYPHVASSALNALQQIANNRELENDRKKQWTLSYYDFRIIKIKELDNEKQLALKDLTQRLTFERNERQKEIDAIWRVKNEIKKRFEDTFTSLGDLTDELHNRLWSILREDKEFLYAHSDPGKYRNSAFSGVIVSNDEIIYFEQMRYNRAMAIRFDEITDILKPKTIDAKFKIYVAAEKWILLGPKLYDNEMIAFIEEKYQKIIMN